MTGKDARTLLKTTKGDGNYDVVVVIIHFSYASIEAINGSLDKRPYFIHHLATGQSTLTLVL